MCLQLIQEGSYSIESCYLALRKTIDSILQYAKNIDMEIYNKIRDYAQSSISLMKCITDFVNIVKYIIKDIFEYQEQKNANRSLEKIEKVKTYIEKNIGSDLSLYILADMISVTPQYLCRLFKEHTGMNYHDYITKLKMKKAAELIKLTNMTVNEVSEKLGYNNSSYFIRKFKENYGLTPGEFREKEYVNQ